MNDGMMSTVDTSMIQLVVKGFTQVTSRVDGWDYQWVTWTLGPHRATLACSSILWSNLRIKNRNPLSCYHSQIYIATNLLVARKHSTVFSLILFNCRKQFIDLGRIHVSSLETLKLCFSLWIKEPELLPINFSFKFPSVSLHEQYAHCPRLS